MTPNQTYTESAFDKLWRAEQRLDLLLRSSHRFAADVDRELREIRYEVIQARRLVKVSAVNEV